MTVSLSIGQYHISNNPCRFSHLYTWLGALFWNLLTVKVSLHRYLFLSRSSKCQVYRLPLALKQGFTLAHSSIRLEFSLSHPACYVTELSSVGFLNMLAIHFERFPGWVAKLFLLLELLKQLDTQIHASIRVLALSLSSWVHGVDRRVHNWLLTLRSLIIEHGVVTELLKSILFHQLSKIAWSGARSLPCSIFCHFGISRINIHTMRRGNVINNSTEYIV